ncbi:PH domain-like [Phytophthora cactorum]|nr:PH domain-like [Phytophthora cactorum]
MQAPTPPGSADASPVRSNSKKPSPADFMFGATLGEGAYARVRTVAILEGQWWCTPRMKDTGVEYAHQKEQAAAGYTDRACSLELTRFYIAEVVVALEYLHKMPENILLSDDGHLKVTDFGTAKDETEESRHNTFCGTAEYVSPEVLRDQEASRGCDLWAMACMVFQMLVGRPMFRAENEYLTFQQILNHPAEDFVYPPGFPPVAKDLIDRILLQEPIERLGAGSDDDGNGYAALKAHPFFEGVDWDSVGYAQSTYVPEIGRLPPTEYDGATEDWLFAGVATELQVSSGLALDPLPSPAEHVNVVEVARQKAAIPPAMRRTSSLWNRFLLDDELIKMGGLISKRKGLFSKKRQLILTSKPRLIYIDPIRMKQKGEIPWSDNLYVNSKSATAFDVVTPNRVYHLNDLVNGSKKWIEAINAALVRGM